MTRARAFWVAAPGHGEIREERLRAPGPGEVRVKTICSGISRGTETLVFLGRVPASQREAMRAPFQAGDLPGPVKYGYATVGLVEEGPAGLRGCRVFALHPHQDRFVLPADAVLPVPDDVPDARAALAANMETAVNAIWDALPALGDRVVVVGAGTVGCLAAALAARFPAVDVQLVDIDASKAAVPSRLGIHAFASPENAWEHADLVLHASGTAGGLATALRAAAFEATVVELSWYGDRDVAVPLGGNFHSRRLVLKSSQVGNVPPARRARWSRSRRLALALEMLRDPRFDCLLSGESRLDDLPRTMARLAEAPPGTFCHVVRYE